MNEKFDFQQFLHWCARCKYLGKGRGEQPCKDCLNQPMNTDPNKKSKWKMDDSDAKIRV